MIPDITPAIKAMTPLPAETRERIERIAGFHFEQWRIRQGNKSLRSAFKEALTQLAEEERRERWQPIETAPKDGTIIDLFVNGSRYPNCAWGKPDHCCGEAGEYCDSDWHTEKPRWFDTTFSEFIHYPPTHWMPLPTPPPS